MKKWTKTAGLLFMAASSVYYGQAVVAAPAKSGGGADGGKPAGTDVRLLEELTPGIPGKKAAPADGAAAPAPGDKTETAAPAQPAAPAKTEGRSVSKSEVNVNDEGTVEIH